MESETKEDSGKGQIGVWSLNTFDSLAHETKLKQQLYKVKHPCSKM
jgi:hypothetical protein